MDPVDLERLTDRALRSLPTPRAPRSLLPRVLAAVAAEASRPWYARAWLSWPLHWQLVSGAATAVCGHRGHVRRARHGGGDARVRDQHEPARCRRTLAGTVRSLDAMWDASRIVWRVVEPGVALRRSVSARHERGLCGLRHRARSCRRPGRGIRIMKVIRVLVAIVASSGAASVTPLWGQTPPSRPPPRAGRGAGPRRASARGFRTRHVRTARRACRLAAQPRPELRGSRRRGHHGRRDDCRPGVRRRRGRARQPAPRAHGRGRGEIVVVGGVVDGHARRQARA